MYSFSAHSSQTSDHSRTTHDEQNNKPCTDGLLGPRCISRSLKTLTFSIGFQAGRPPNPYKEPPPTTFANPTSGASPFSSMGVPTEQ